MSTDPQVASRLRRVLGRLDGLPEADVASIGVMVDAGEWALALEVLCTQAYEYDLELPGPLRAEIAELDALLG